MKTFEQFLRDNAIELTEGTIGYKQGLRGKITEGSDYRLTVYKDEKGEMVVYVHPLNRGGETPFYKVNGNTLIQEK